MTSRPFKTHVDIPVRFRDTDALGHVNNAVYLSYLETARVRYWTQLTGKFRWQDCDFVVARIEIDYRSTCTVGEELRVWIRTAALGRSSFTCEYRIEERATGRLVAEARSVQAFYDYAKRKVKRMDAGMREKIEAFEEMPAGKV